MLRLTALFSKAKLPESPFRPPAYTGPSLQEVNNLRKQHMFQSYFHYYKQPVYITGGRGQYLFDEKGKQYLDLVAGIAVVSVGHCHPRITKVIAEQAEKLVHTSTIYLNQCQGLYAEALAKRAPPGLDCVFLTNSGSQANDLALVMSRLYTNSYKIISLRNAYHGNVMGLTNIQNWNHGIERGFFIQKSAFPGIFRSNYRGQNSGDFHAKQVAELVESTSNGRIAGWISQPVMGAGGIVTMPEGYLQKVYKVIRQYGGLCISDEVQTGFGRIGTKYWGCYSQGVTPDIMTMAKGIGNGWPLGAVLTSKKVADVMNTKLFFNTFSAGPIACRIGMEVLDIIDSEKLPQNAQTVGKHFLEGLKRIAEKTRYIGEARGKGLMIAIEIVKDKESKVPDTETTGLLFEKLKERGILIGKGGPYGTILRSQPPLCVTKQDIDYTLSVLQDITNEVK